MPRASATRSACALPIGVPTAFIEPVDDPVGDLVSRYARTHGPFVAADAASRFGLGVAVVTDTLRRLAADRRVVDGEFRPGASGTEWVSAEVLRRPAQPVARRAPAGGRARPATGVRPASCLAWQQVGGSLRGPDGLAPRHRSARGVPIPASALETLVLPARLADYSPA